MRATETARNTGNQTFGLMKIADSATAVQRSVTKVALISSLPMPVSVKRRSTRTAYTTASEVVDNAAPAINEARVDQSSRIKATSEAMTNGPANEATPIASDDPSLRRR